MTINPNWFSMSFEELDELGLFTEKEREKYYTRGVLFLSEVKAFNNIPTEYLVTEPWIDFDKP